MMERMGVAGRAVAWFFTTLRDLIARGLLKLHLTPNMLTVAGVVPSVVAGVLFAVGRPGWAAGVVIFSGAFDMLDGAVARLGNLYSRFGGVLDSSLDRLSDFALFGGLAWYVVFTAGLSEVGRGVYLVLSMVALAGAFGTSYVRARAECIIDGKVDVGFWERGERIAAIIIAGFAGHLETLLWVLAVGGAVTSLQRLVYARMVLERGAGHDKQHESGPLVRLALWEYPRKTWIYDVTVVAWIAVLIFIDVRWWLR